MLVNPSEGGSVKLTLTHFLFTYNNFLSPSSPPLLLSNPGFALHYDLRE